MILNVGVATLQGPTSPDPLSAVRSRNAAINGDNRIRRKRRVRGGSQPRTYFFSVPGRSSNVVTSPQGRSDEGDVSGDSWTMITIVDYNAGNLTSVKRALDSLGVGSRITADAGEIRRAGRIIFPGVGHASAAMEILRRRGIDAALREAFGRGAPILGRYRGPVRSPVA